jgi:hypothetical protein
LVTTLSPIDLLMLQSADSDEQDRLQRFKLGWEVYEGDMKQPLKVEFGEPDDNVILPFARSFVDTSIKFLLGEDLEFKGTNEKLDELIQRSWSGGGMRSNKKMLTLNKLAINGGVTGQPFLKLAPQKDYTRLIVLDPSYVSVLWSQEDIDEVRRYRIQWPIIDGDNKPAVRRQDVTKQDGGTWLIEDFISKSGTNQWEMIHTETWPFDFAPIIETQNLVKPNEYWGESDLERGLIQINDSINSVISDVRKILRYHASPKTIAEGIQPDQFDELNADPSALLFVPDGASLSNLELTGDLEASVRTYLELKSALHEISSIPEVATGKLNNVGQLSARAMQILYKPLIDLTTTKRMTYGHLIDEANRRIAIIDGQNGDEIPDILWPDVLPKDAIDERTAAEADLRMGIASKETIASKLGYDWEQESEKIGEEGTSMGETVLTNFDRANTAGASEIVEPPV